MTTTTERKGGLGANAPERDGRAQDCYHVAQTALFVGRRWKDGDWWSAAARHAVRLHTIAGALHRMSEAECNLDMTCPECRGEGYPMRPGGERGRGACRKCAGDGRTTGKRKARLRADAEEIAAHYGMRCYFQTDPRGCPLYLVPGEIVPEDWPTLKPYAYSGELPNHDRPRLQARWIDANYTKGHAVARLGR